MEPSVNHTFKKIHVDTKWRSDSAPPQRRASAQHATHTRHAASARDHATPDPAQCTARPQHHAQHDPALQTHNMRQNTPANSTLHTAHGTAGPIGRLVTTGPRVPLPRAQNLACAAVPESPSTQNAMAQMQTTHSPAPSACQTRSPTSSRSPAATQRAQPSLMSARHAQVPARARTRRARTARPAQARRGSFRSRKWGVKATCMPIAICA